MTYYIFIENNKINGCGQCECGNEETQNIEVPEEIYNLFMKDSDHYIWNGTEIVYNPDYEEIKQAKEKARIMKLKMTPLDFLKAIEQYGITYDMVKEYMEQNPLVEREIRFCQNVYRNHPMLQALSEYGITSDILDTIFKKANGEEE